MNLRSLLCILASVLCLLGARFDAIAAQPVAELSTQLAAPKLSRDDKGVVTITCDTAGAVIRYTLDNADPGPKSGPYLAPIELPHGGTVKARAFTEDRKQMSEPVEAKYDSLPNLLVVPNTLVPLTQDRDWPIYDWAKRHAAVSALAKERQPQLVFIGDSITHMFGDEPHDRNQPGKDLWEKIYRPRNVVNLGFGYDYVENTLWRIQHGELGGAKPKAAVIMIGTNNMGKNKPEEIAEGVKVLCGEIHRQTPGTKILLLGIFPRGPKPDAMRVKIADTNKLLAKLEGQDNVTFLDFGAKFLGDDGTISREIMGDFLHPTAKGYEIWVEAMEPTLARLLGETKP